MSELHKREIKYCSDNGHPWEEAAKDAELYQATLKAKNSNNFGEFVYGKSLTWYKDVVIWPMFILLVLEIGLRVLQKNYFITSPETVFTWIINLLRVILFSYLTISAVRHFKATKKQTLTAAIIGGGVLGVVLAVFQLFWYFELWTFFNLIGQPLLLAAEGLIISWLTYKLFLEKLKNF